MTPFTTFDGTALPLFEDNIDTDQLCPKQHLSAIRRVGFGAALFSDRRWHPDGSINHRFTLNDPRHADAGILIGGLNFGSGSSREHAVWALADYGISCVIAPSFGDIFLRNTVNSGLLAIQLPVAIVAGLADLARDTPDGWHVDLVGLRIIPPGAEAIPFEVEPARRQRLIEGWDEIDLTLQYQAQLAAYQRRQRHEQPWLWDIDRTGQPAVRSRRNSA